MKRSNAWRAFGWSVSFALGLAFWAALGAVVARWVA